MIEVSGLSKRYGNVYALRQGGVADDQPLRFPGQQVVSSTSGGEESYNIFRWYRSGWGRYTQGDPFSPQAAATEPYSYARENPLRSVDPLGLFEIRRTWDFTKTKPGTPGDSGFRIDLDNNFYDCDETGAGCWKLKFTLYVDFTMQYDDQGTYAHEWKHLQILESYLYPILKQYFGPPELTSYKTFAECRNAALAARDRFRKDYNPWQGYWKQLWHDMTDPGYH